ncbi:MAG: extensin family protein [Rhizobiales bacterium]|nr:extensin family protein [Hyphomicrobiales bacterium]
MRQTGPLTRSVTLRVLGRVLLAVLVFAALAYPASRMGVFEWPRAYDPLALPDLDARPNFLTDWQLRLAEVDPEGCAVALRRAGVDAHIRPDHGAGACVISGGVNLARLSRAGMRPEETRCVVAARLYLWERHVLQPAAIRIMGEPVSEILHFGSYSCRTIRGRSSMSQHSTANAFDISGFRLASGKTISLKADWAGNDAAARFLRAARDGLCDWFNVTLSPDYNADHADHFHVDMGWYRTCR